MALILEGRNTPGYELFTGVAGPTIPVVAVLSRCYLLTTATLTTQTDPGELVAIGSLDDFTNLFGSSDAIVLDSIEIYLQNYPQGLYVARVAPAPYTTVLLTALAAGDRTITINGTTVTFTLDATPTNQEAITAAVTAINNNTTINLDVEAEYLINASGQPDYTGGAFRIRQKRGTTPFTATGSTGVTVGAVTTPTAPQYWDWMAAIRALDVYDDEPLGFLAIPQAYFNLTNQFERTQVANTADEVCRKLGWFHYIDPHNPATIDHPRKAKTDAKDTIALQGHTAYTYPYFVNRDSDLIAPSVAIASVALRLYQQFGIQEPPAGVRCVISGVSGVQYRLNQAQKVDLAEASININIFLAGYGAMPYDVLTRSEEEAFKTINGRIILSSFERTLRDTLRGSRLLFRAIDGLGRFYSELGLTVTGVCDLFYQARALYGATPGEAYYVRCNAAMQDATALENGDVVFELYLILVPPARRIKGYTYRVAIGKMAQTVGLLAAVA